MYHNFMLNDKYVNVLLLYEDNFQMIISYMCKKISSVFSKIGSKQRVVQGKSQEFLFFFSSNFVLLHTALLREKNNFRNKIKLPIVLVTVMMILKFYRRLVPLFIL